MKLKNSMLTLIADLISSTIVVLLEPSVFIISTPGVLVVRGCVVVCAKGVRVGSGVEGVEVDNIAPMTDRNGSASPKMPLSNPSPFSGSSSSYRKISVRNHDH